MENLYERLDILEQAGLITPFVSEQAKKIVELITECGSPMDEEKMAMFTTHIAMAIQRILNGDVENPLEEAVLEELRKSYLSRGGKYSGYMTVMKDFVPLLRARGIKQETLNRFLIENPARIFDKAD